MFIRWKVGFEIEQRNHLKYLDMCWDKPVAPSLKFDYNFKLTQYWLHSSPIFKDFIFTNNTIGSRVVYTHNTHYFHSMPETVEHRKIRIKNTDEDVLSVIFAFVVLLLFDVVFFIEKRIAVRKTSTTNF